MRKNQVVESDPWALRATHDCCKPWGSLIKNMVWFRYSENHSVVVTPCMEVDGNLVRVKYCPFCGKGATDRVVDERRVTDIRIPNWRV